MNISMKPTITAPLNTIGTKLSQTVKPTLSTSGSDSKYSKPDVEFSREKDDIEALQSQKKDVGNKKDSFHSEALEKLLDKVTEALEKENVAEEDTSETEIDEKQLKTLGLIIQKYAGQDLSFTEWSGLYQELQTEGYDISKPLLDIML